MDGRMKWMLALGVAAVAAAFGLAVAPGGSAALAQGGGVEIDPDDIGGVVTSASGPEVGVWVIAETSDLPTRFIRIVATDEQGRYVLPDLPDRRLRRLGARLRPGRLRARLRAAGGSTWIWTPSLRPTASRRRRSIPPPGGCR